MAWEVRSRQRVGNLGVRGDNTTSQGSGRKGAEVVENRHTANAQE
jgi:hypothetical protein